MVEIDKVDSICLSIFSWLINECTIKNSFREHFENLRTFRLSLIYTLIKSYKVFIDDYKYVDLKLHAQHPFLQSPVIT